MHKETKIRYESILPTTFLAWRTRKKNARTCDSSKHANKGIEGKMTEGLEMRIEKRESDSENQKAGCFAGRRNCCGRSAWVFRRHGNADCAGLTGVHGGIWRKNSSYECGGRRRGAAAVVRRSLILWRQRRARGMTSRGCRMRSQCRQRAHYSCTRNN